MHATRRRINVILAKDKQRDDRSKVDSNAQSVHSIIVDPNVIVVQKEELDDKHKGSRDRQHKGSRDRERKGSRDRERRGSRDRERKGSRDKEERRVHRKEDVINETKPRKRSASPRREQTQEPRRDNHSRHIRERRSPFCNRERPSPVLYHPHDQWKHSHNQYDSYRGGRFNNHNNDNDNNNNNNNNINGTVSNSYVAALGDSMIAMQKEVETLHKNFFHYSSVMNRQQLIINEMDIEMRSCALKADIEKAFITADIEMKDFISDAYPVVYVSSQLCLDTRHFLTLLIAISKIHSEFSFEIVRPREPETKIQSEKMRDFKAELIEYLKQKKTTDPNVKFVHLTEKTPVVCTCCARPSCDIGRSHVALAEFIGGHFTHKYSNATIDIKEGDSDIDDVADSRPINPGPQQQRQSGVYATEKFCFLTVEAEEPRKLRRDDKLIMEERNAIENGHSVGRRNSNVILYAQTFDPHNVTIKLLGENRFKRVVLNREAIDFLNNPDRLRMLTHVNQTAIQCDENSVIKACGLS